MHKPNQKPEHGATVPKHYVGEPNIAEREAAAKEVKIAAATPVEQAFFPEESPVVEETPAPQQDLGEESPKVKPAEEDVVPYKL